MAPVGQSGGDLTPRDWALHLSDAHSSTGCKIPLLVPVFGPGVVHTGGYMGGDADGRKSAGGLYIRTEREAGSNRPPVPAVLPLPDTQYRAAPSLELGYRHGTRATESLDTAPHYC